MTGIEQTTCGQKPSFSSSPSPQGVAFRDSLTESPLPSSYQDNAFVQEDQNERNNDCILKLPASMLLQKIQIKSYLYCV